MTKNQRRQVGRRKTWIRENGFRFNLGVRPVVGQREARLRELRKK